MKSVGPDRKSKYAQGYYRLVNKAKYLNLKENIIYRSSYELTLCRICDTSPQIVKWQSEPFGVPYFDPVKQKNRMYYPDFLIVIQGEDGTLSKLVVEVKPTNFLTKPQKPVSVTAQTMKTYNFKLGVYVTNMAKFQAAKKFCESRGMRYSFLNESFFNKFRA